MKTWCAVSRTGMRLWRLQKRLFDAYWEYFRPARERRAELEANQDYVRRTLEEGARKARETASVVLDRVRRAVGLA